MREINKKRSVTPFQESHPSSCSADEFRGSGRVDLKVKMSQTLAHGRLVAGFTLIETLVALYVLMYGLIGAMSLAFQGLKSVEEFRDQLVGSNLAQEGLELVRNKRDSNYLQHKYGVGVPACDLLCDSNKFNSEGIGAICLPMTGCRVENPIANPLVFIECDAAEPGLCKKIKRDEKTGLYGYTAGVETKYDRRIYVIPVNEYVRGAGISDYQVISTVSWVGRFGKRSIQLKTVLTPHVL